MDARCGALVALIVVQAARGQCWTEEAKLNASDPGDFENLGRPQPHPRP